MVNPDFLAFCRSQRVLTHMFHIEISSAAIYQAGWFRSNFKGIPTKCITEVLNGYLKVQGVLLHPQIYILCSGNLVTLFWVLVLARTYNLIMAIPCAPWDSMRFPSMHRLWKPRPTEDLLSSLTTREMHFCVYDHEIFLGA